MNLLSAATADITIHKVFSHGDPEQNISPFEDWCHEWNRQADQQAMFANLTRPVFFQRLWRGYQQWRNLWKRRVQLHSEFVVHIAAQDFTIEPDFEPTDTVSEVGLQFDCERHTNSLAFSSRLLTIQGREEFFVF